MIQRNRRVVVFVVGILVWLSISGVLDSIKTLVLARHNKSVVHNIVAMSIILVIIYLLDRSILSEIINGR